jgi:hypothetical protein
VPAARRAAATVGAAGASGFRLGSYGGLMKGSACEQRERLARSLLSSALNGQTIPLDSMAPPHPDIRRSSARIYTSQALAHRAVVKSSAPHLLARTAVTGLAPVVLPACRARSQAGSAPSKSPGSQHCHIGACTRLLPRSQLALGSGWDSGCTTTEHRKGRPGQAGPPRAQPARHK